ncbi:MAG TPA: galactose-1-phosphate uridylyltransferase [Actinopolymorphaceae bacterium]
MTARPSPAAADPPAELGVGVRKTVTPLADGRELIYYDEPDTVREVGPRDAVDERDLGPRAPGSDLRYDPVLDEWVAIAAHRQTRPFLPPTDQCPLCPSRDGHLTEVPASDYDVVVFENRFPSFSQVTHPVVESDDPELWPRREGKGRCEVVCFSSDHGGSFASLTPERVGTVMAVWADRTAELSTRPDVELVFPFENRGEEIGVTLHHPHGQIYGYPFVPPRVRRMLESATAHRERTGRNLFDDVVAAERAAEVRVVEETAHWIAFVPQAARWPVEVHLYPRRRVPDLAALTPAERADFGPLYLRVMRSLDVLFGVPLPYIAAWYQAPTRHARDLMALHLEVMSVRRAPGKLKYLAGSESAMGAWINDVAPEDMAERVRKGLR